MRLLEIKGDIHDSYFTFETALIGREYVYFDKNGEANVLMPIYQLATESEELTKGEVESVYIERSYFLFSEVLNCEFSGAIHNNSASDFINRTTKITTFSSKLDSSVIKNFELGGMGLLDFDFSYDGNYKVSAKKVFLLVPEFTSIESKFPGAIKINKVSMETKLFLLSSPIEVYNKISLK